MTKSQSENPLVEQPRTVTYRTTEAPVTYELVKPETDVHIREYSGSKTKSSHYAIAAQHLPRPRIDDLIPRSQHSHHSSRSATRSHVEGVINPPNVTKISVAALEDSRISHASAYGKTARQSDLTRISEARSAKDIPLPHSRVTSLATGEREEGKEGRSSVHSKESVSQVSTRRSGENGRSRH